MKKLLLSIATVFSFTLPSVAGVSADSWDLYGSARMCGWYWDRGYQYSEDTVNGGIVDTLFPHLTRMIWDLEYMSRFGAYCKKDNYAFRFEAGWGPVLREMMISVQGTEIFVASKFKDGLILRRLYGEWFINDNLSLLIGQEWCLSNFLVSSQTFEMEAGLYYTGALYTSRRPQVRATAKTDLFEGLKMQLDFAAVKPDTFIVGTSDDVWNVEASEIIPKFEGDFVVERNQDLGGIPLGLKTTTMGGVNRYNLVTNRVANPTNMRTDLIATYVLGENLELTLWKLKSSVTFSMGQNLASYGVYMGDPWGWRGNQDMDIFYPRWGLTSETDTSYGICNTFTKQGTVVMTLKAFDWLALEVGGGMIINDHEEYGTKQQEEVIANMMRRAAWYANIQFNLLDGHLLFIPEFSQSDLGGGINAGGGIWNALGFLLQFDM
ncbi:MAG: hypothetical protein JW768_12370 [Chitinispirillaceae bacterium]|nr:hypothetical protein [Chitinispirillaceae bacterium]